MRSLSTRELLDVWHRGVSESLYRRPLTLLEAACPEAVPEKLSAMSIGRRDANLLTLRERVFGPDLSSVTTCSACGERLELNFRVSDIQVKAEIKQLDKLSLDVDGYEVEFRLPNSLDLPLIAGQPDVGSARQLLLERCVTRVNHDDRDVGLEEVPSEIMDAVTARMAEADPQADVQLALACPACGNEWQATFDIVMFFWTEIETWVRRVLHEVHALASAYRWRETDILEMSPWRRQFYLNLVKG